MASITIRNLDEQVKTLLRMRAAEHQRSMEEEAGIILRQAVEPQPGSRNLAEIAQAHFGPENGVDIEMPPRGVQNHPIRMFPPDSEHYRPAETGCLE